MQTERANEAAGRFWARVFRSVSVVAILSLALSSTSRAAPTEQASPAGELVVVTVNAKQNTTDDARLAELANALRNRPSTSQGGYYAPDVILVNEMNVDASLIAFRDHLNAVFASNQYAIAGTTDPSVKAKFLYNTATMTAETSRTWMDVCEGAVRYQLVRFRESASNIAVTVAGIHFRVNYADATCRQRNAEEVRRQLDGAGRSIVGDFNQRAMEQELECDPYEQSAAKPWYTTMTSQSSIDGISYIDAVRHHYRRLNLSLAQQWTWEAKDTSVLCDGTTNYKRSRIDYLFVSNNIGVHEAHSDSPGWADEAQRGSIGCTPAPQCKYSDHRFVWGRFDVTSAVAPSPPTAPTNLTATASSSTQIDLTWGPTQGASGYKIERSNDGTAGWTQIATTTSPTYSDTGVIENSTRYYRVRATNATGDSAPSNVASATTPASPPSQPTNVSATPGSRKIKLAWTASSDTGGSGLAGYEIWRSSAGTGGPFTKIATTTGTSYTNSGLSKGATYWYYVVAYDNAGNRSTPSTTVSAKAL